MVDAAPSATWRSRLPLGASMAPRLEGALLGCALLYALLWAMTWPVVVLRGRELGLSPAEIGIVLGLVGLGQTLAGIGAANLCDRIGKRAVIVAGFALSGLCWLLFAVAPTALPLALAQLGTGFSAAAATSLTAYFGAHTAASGRAQAMARLLAAMGLGFVAGPLFSAWLLPHGNAVAWVLVVLPLATAVFAHLGLQDSRRADPVPALTVLGVLSCLRVPPGARAALVSLVLLTMTAVVVGYFVPLHARQELMASPTTVSAMFSLMGLLMAAAPVLMVLLSRWLPQHATAQWAYAATVAAVVLCGVAPTMTTAFCAFGMWALAYNLANPHAKALLSRQAAAENQSAVSGVQQAYVGLSNMLVPPVAGWFYETAGMAATFTLAGIVAGVGCVLLLRLSTRQRLGA